MKFILVFFVCAAIAGCGMITGRGLSSEGRWSSGLPYFIEDHEKNEGTVSAVNENGTKLELTRFRLYQTYMRIDGEHMEEKGDRFVLKPQRTADIPKEFKFKKSAIGKIIPADNKRDFFIVFQGYDFTKLYSVTPDGNTVGEFKDAKSLPVNEASVRRYVRRSLALPLLPSYDAFEYAGSSRAVALYKKTFKDDAVASTQALIDDEFDEGRTESRIHYHHTATCIETCYKYHSITDRARRMLDALEGHDTKKGVEEDKEEGMKKAEPDPQGIVIQPPDQAIKEPADQKKTVQPRGAVQQPEAQQSQDNKDPEKLTRKQYDELMQKRLHVIALQETQGTSSIMSEEKPDTPNDKGWNVKDGSGF